MSKKKIVFWLVLSLIVGTIPTNTSSAKVVMEGTQNVTTLSSVVGTGGAIDVPVSQEPVVTDDITYIDHNGVDITEELPEDYEEFLTYEEGVGLTSIPTVTPYTNDGYTFVGWYDAQTDGNQVIAISSTHTGEVTLYAVWEEEYFVPISQAPIPESYDIIYTDHNGVDITDELPEDYADYTSYTEGEGLAAIPDVTPYTNDGYTFAGWYDAQTDGNQVTEISSTQTGEVTLYARWEEEYIVPVSPVPSPVPVSYNIIYKNHNGVDITEELPEDYGDYSSYTEGVGLTSIPTVTPYTRAGYHFAGWYTAQTDGEQVTEITITQTGEVTLYARWTSEAPTYVNTSTSNNESENSSDSNSGNSTDQNISETVISSNEVVSATKNDDGYYYGSDGEKLVSTLITAEDESLAALDESGNTVKESLVSTSDGSKYYADETGKIIVNKVFTATDGTKYAATKDGTLAVSSFATTAKGNQVYATADGTVARSTIITMDDGTQYYAAKSGKIVKSKWITIGDIMYYCNKKGIIVKSKTAE